MKTTELVAGDMEFTKIGEVFDTPIVVRGITWLPILEVLLWGFTAWLAGRRCPDRTTGERLRVGLVTMPILVGLEWAHNFAHAAVASHIGKPMDAMRITWGTPLVIYDDINDPSVSPRQHIFRAIGGPIFNALLLPVSLFLYQQSRANSVTRDMTAVAVGMNAFLSTVSMLPIPGIDGGPILKWSLVERGRTPGEADEVVRKVNGVLGVFLAIASVLAFLKKQKIAGIVMAPFAALMLAIGMGHVREQ